MDEITKIKLYTIYEPFMRAGEARLGKRGFTTDDEWASRAYFKGVHYFKRRVLGFCGGRALKQADQLAKILFEIGAAESVPIGREMVGWMVGKQFHYRPLTHYLTVEPIKNDRGQTAYRVINHVPDY